MYDVQVSQAKIQNDINEQKINFLVGVYDMILILVSNQCQNSQRRNAKMT